MEGVRLSAVTRITAADANPNLVPSEFTKLLPEFNCGFIQETTGFHTL